MTAAAKRSMSASSTGRAVARRIGWFSGARISAASVAARMDIAVDVQIAVRAELQLDSGRVAAMTRDISSTGAFVACTAPLFLGDTLRLTMLLPGEDDWTLVQHEFLGVVARVENSIGYGIQFTEVPEAYLEILQTLLGSA